MSGEPSGEFIKQFPLERPSILERKAFSGENKVQPSEEILVLDKERLGLIIDVLNHPAMERLIDQGHVTLGAIKPNAHQSKLEASDDVSAEEKLLEYISERNDTNLQIMFAVSLEPSREKMEEFYKDVKEKLQSIPKNGRTVWDEMIESMTKGSVTYFLLYSPTGDAIEEWRRVVGATDPSKADKDTIRGKFALGLPGNLVHGSSGDTLEEAVVNVKHEAYWLRDRLVDMQKKLGNPKPSNLSSVA